LNQLALMRRGGGAGGAAARAAARAELDAVRHDASGKQFVYRWKYTI
jgi:hypothetical protein